MAARKLNDRDIELLVEYVKAEHCLWKCSDGSYLNVDKCKAAWRRISEKLDGIDVGEYHATAFN